MVDLRVRMDPLLALSGVLDVTEETKDTALKEKTMFQ